MIVKNILICEDIRQEIGNKLSVMGILGDALNVGVPQNAPKEIPLSLAFLITIENDDIKKDPRDFKVSITMQLGEKPLAKIEAQVTSNGTERVFHLPVPRVGIQLVESTKLTIQTQITKNDKVVSEDTANLNINLERNS